MSRTFRAGLVVLGALSVLDLLLPLLSDGEHPPMPVALVAAVMGLASLVLVVSAWRGAARAVVPLVILRVLSAVAAVPAIFEPGVPAPLVIGAGVILLVTIIGVALVLSARVRAGAR